MSFAEAQESLINKYYVVETKHSFVIRAEYKPCTPHKSQVFAKISKAHHVSAKFVANHICQRLNDGLQESKLVEGLYKKIAEGEDALTSLQIDYLEAQEELEYGYARRKALEEEVRRLSQELLQFRLSLRTRDHLEKGKKPMTVQQKGACNENY